MTLGVRQAVCVSVHTCTAWDFSALEGLAQAVSHGQELMATSVRACLSVRGRQPWLQAAKRSGSVRVLPGGEAWSVHWAC